MAFPDTPWSVLALASVHGDSAAHQALDELSRRYWQPVYAVICSRGWGSESARDRTQSFFLYLLETSTLRKVDRTRGRFRTFLLTVLWRFLRDEQQREEAAKRGGTSSELPWQEVEDELPSIAIPVSEILDREWAMTTLERALESVRQEFVAKRGEVAWRVWRGFLPGSTVIPSMGMAAEAMGISEASARAEVHRLRTRCREALRRELMRTVSSPEELDEEVHYLGRALRAAASRAEDRIATGEDRFPSAQR